MQEARRDQIETARRERQRKVMRLEPDAPGDLGTAGILRGIPQRHGRDIDSRVLPTLPGQPDRVVTPRTAQIQHAARREWSCELRKRQARFSEGLSRHTFF